METNAIAEIKFGGNFGQKFVRWLRKELENMNLPVTYYDPELSEDKNRPDEIQFVDIEGYDEAVDPDGDLYPIFAFYPDYEAQDDLTIAEMNRELAKFNLIVVLAHLLRSQFEARLYYLDQFRRLSSGNKRSSSGVERTRSRSSSVNKRSQSPVMTAKKTTENRTVAKYIKINEGAKFAKWLEDNLKMQGVAYVRLGESGQTRITIHGKPFVIKDNLFDEEMIYKINRELTMEGFEIEMFTLPEGYELKFNPTLFKIGHYSNFTPKELARMHL